MVQLSHQILPHSGKTILFLHGFLGNSQQWNPLVEHFRESHQILLIDLPGHGASPASSSYAIAQIADAIHNILKEQNINSIHFVGHSMGGYVGCAFAKAYPEKTASLHLINSCASGDSDSRKSQRNRSIQLVSRHPAAFVSMAVTHLFTENERELFENKIKMMKADAQNLAAESIIHAIAAMRDRPSQLESLKVVSFPIHYIYGADDQIVPSDIVETELHSIKANVTKLASGHMSLITHKLELINKMRLIE